MSENKLVEFLDELREFPDRLFSKGQMGIFWKVDPISMLTEIKGILEEYPRYLRCGNLLVTIWLFMNKK